MDLKFVMIPEFIIKYIHDHYEMLQIKKENWLKIYIDKIETTEADKNKIK